MFRLFLWQGLGKLRDRIEMVKRIDCKLSEIDSLILQIILIEFLDCLNKSKDRECESERYFVTQKTKEPDTEYLDGYKNFYYYTKLSNGKKVQLRGGINPIARVYNNGISRVPAIVTSSSPHNIGSAQNPWQDIYNVERSHILAIIRIRKVRMINEAIRRY